LNNFKQLKNILFILIAIVISLIWVSACRPLAAPTQFSPSGAGTLVVSPSPGKVEASPTAPVLATPYAEIPVAGICAGPEEGEIVSVEIWPDIPSPRCIKLAPEQKLLVLNRTELVIHIRLGTYRADIQPGDDYLFERTVGSYLGPGVHQLLVEPFSGPELWLPAEYIKDDGY